MSTQMWPLMLPTCCCMYLYCTTQPHCEVTVNAVQQEYIYLCDATCNFYHIYIRKRQGFGTDSCTHMGFLLKVPQH